MHPRFEIKCAKGTKFYFILTAKNGQTIAMSEMYNTLDAAENGVRSVKENAEIAPVHHDIAEGDDD